MSSPAAPAPRRASPPAAHAAQGAPPAAPPAALRRAWDGVDLSPFVRLSQDGFEAALDAVADAKTLLIDPSLAGPLGLVADLASLRKRGVEKMFWLEEDDEGSAHARIHAPTTQLLYFCRPEIRWMRTIAAHMLADRADGQSPSYTYTIAFVPHRTEPCVQFLRQQSLLQGVSIIDFGLEFSVLASDVLSLEDARTGARIFLHGDQTGVFRSAQALMTMQLSVGLFPRILGKGDMAQRLCDMLVRQRREHCASDPGNAALQTPSAAVDALIVLDRTVDLVTPLSTQLTYAGLIDELIGVDHGFVEVDAAWLGATAAPQGRASAPLGATRRVRLDSADDALFAAVRDENFAVVGERLHDAAKRISQDYSDRHQASTVQEIRAFVSRLGGLQSEHASLRLHTALTEHLFQTTKTERFHALLEIQQNLVAGIQFAQQLQAIDELVALEVPLLAVLRLACLASVLAGGVREKWLEAFRIDVVHTYGYQFLPLLLALEQMHILCAPASAAPPAKTPRTSRVGDVQKVLRLIDDDVDERAPDDISYVFSGYAPLSVRLVQALCQHPIARAPRGARADRTQPTAPVSGWDAVDDAVRHLPGANVDVAQADGAFARDTDAVRTTVVFFLGGVTYAEIAALRLLSRQQQSRRFLIAATSIVNGNTLLSGLDSGGMKG
ncbi:Vacuolar protein-sorting-associated protein 33 [Malassezia sp. CBS 17886]|nr:Vacuolar protein-sorting-associated protein 33 [Malassezia sp. CBS 17886]